MSVGKICEFQLTSGKNWKTYIARLEQYFLANKIEENLKVATLLTVVGDDTYELMVDLCSPDAPETQTYKNLVKIVTNHLQPEPSVIAERHKFRQRRQEKGESITQYMGALKNLAKTCDFKDKLDENLRDQFVSGLSSEVIKQRLFSEKLLTYGKSYEIARNMEAAERNVTFVEATQSVHKIQHGSKHHDASPSFRNNPSRSQESTSGGSTSQRSHGLQSSCRQQMMRRKSYTSNGKERKMAECTVCGRHNHTKGECFYKKATCDICGKIGHLKYICKNRNKQNNVRKNKNHYIDKLESDILTEPSCSNRDESDTDSSINLFNVKGTHKSSPIKVELKIENVKISMEVDTGSAVSLISDNIYDKYFSSLPIFSSKIKLSSYTGNQIETKGFILVKVKYNEVEQTLKLYIVPKGGPSLLGRKWLSALKINIINNVAVNSIMKVDENKCINILINDYKCIFDTELGKFQNFKATLYLKPNTVPVFCKSRSLAINLKTKVENALEKLVKEGVLTAIDHSEWASPIVPVIKKNGEVRICGDFKISVNPNLLINQYPLPRIEAIFSNLSGGVLFSKIDLSQAYLQLELDQSSKQLCTINTHKGLFRYNRLPYGIASSPSIFQKLMDSTFSNLEGVVVFMDDILVTGSNLEQHVYRLRKVFEKIKESGLKINLKKCSFLQKSVNYLGHTIDANGLHPNDEKVQAILNMKVPTNETELKSFLGMVNYYGRFLANLSPKLNKLYYLLRDNVKWHWDQQCQNTFELIKNELASPKVLVHYDPKLPLALSCDASSTGLGAVVSHIFPNGDMRPIAHASRTLCNAEKNYSQIDKEALSIIFGVKKFHEYLFANKFILYTDHKPLLALFGEKKGIPSLAASRLQRWSIILSAYQYEIKYIKSEKNCNADALSRLSLPNSINKELDFGHIFYIEESLPVNHKQIAFETQRDPILNRVYKYCFTGWPENIKDIDSELKSYFYRKDQLHLEHGCILWGVRVIVPKKLQNYILKEIHSSHLGMNKCKSIARSYCYWPLIDQEIENLCKNCQICTQIQPYPTKTILQPWPQTNRPWSRIHVDFLGPLYNDKYFVVTDSYTKWLEVFKMNTTNAKSVINCLRTLFSRFGLPDTLVSDNGPPFSSSEFSVYMKKNGIKHLFSPPYHAQSNGFAENSVKNIKNAIKKAYLENKDTEEFINRFLFDYRISQHATTGVSPAILMYGRNLKTRLDLIRPSHSNIIENKMQSQIDDFDGKLKDIHVGDSVFVKDFSNSTSTWVPGKVINQTGNVTFDINLGEDRVVRRHSNQLKKRESLAYPLSTEVTERKNNTTRDTNVNISDETFDNTKTLVNPDMTISESNMLNSDIRKSAEIISDNTSVSDPASQNTQSDSSSARYFLRSRTNK